MTTRFFAFDGDRIAYTRQGAGEPILFIGNMGSVKECWAHQVAALSDRYEVICADHLGLGESDVPAPGFNVDRYLRFLSAFIDHLGFERINYVGNCMGSAMGLLLAEQRPERFAKMVVINPLSAQTAKQGKVLRVVRLAERFPRVLAFGLALTATIRQPRWKMVGKLVNVGQFGPRNWPAALARPLPEPLVSAVSFAKPGSLRSTGEIVCDLPGLARIDALRPGPDFPALAVIWGDLNIGLSPQAGRELNRSLNPQKAVALPNAGHLAMVEQPDDVTAVIEKFLASE
ncbi:alpha/beta fold hydrolase [Nocardia colli]|uniref:alpha/beta fold hydrolase n=1 Tax=Nocardia colli TaxID=2545717 RepID=UPI0035DD2895